MEKKTKTEDLQVRPKNVRESDDYSHVVAGRGKNDALRSLLKWGLIDQKISIPTRLRFSLKSLMVVIALASFASICFKGYVDYRDSGRISIRLETGYEIVSHEDIVSVDWDSQTYLLSKGTKTLLYNTYFKGSPRGIVSPDSYLPFDFCVDEKVLYSGKLISQSDVSQAAINDIQAKLNALKNSALWLPELGAVIDIHPGSKDDNSISIAPLYPSQPVPKHLKDLRFQESLKRCLKYHRKLRYQSR